MATYLTSGDFGDALYGLPSVRALGGGELYFVSRPWTRTRWDSSLLATIKPLIDQTGYCQAKLHQGEWIDHDFSTFRNGGQKLGRTIAERESRWVGAGNISLEPWLRAEPEPKAKIVINRGARWQGFHFPWHELLLQFDHQLIFIGLPAEHQAFEKEYGKVPFAPTRDLLEAAQLIAGSELFIGNQSACLAIANGLGQSGRGRGLLLRPGLFLQES